MSETIEFQFGQWVKYTDPHSDYSDYGKVKGQNSDGQVIFVVFRCDNRWDVREWANYTAEGVPRDRLEVASEYNVMNHFKIKDSLRARVALIEERRERLIEALCHPDGISVSDCIIARQALDDIEIHLPANREKRIAPMVKDR